MDNAAIYKKIRDKGGRVTKIRREIIQILSKTDCLIQQADILVHLKKKKTIPDRSTIYRELLFLVRNGIVLKSSISGADYYEIPKDHHHHLVCLNCDAIEKVNISNHLVKQEKQIEMQNKFNIVYHSLEFYGYCSKCRP